MGVGLSISTKVSTSSNKIVFDDDLETEEYETIDEAVVGNRDENEARSGESDDDDDDDAIEEIKSSVARDKAMEQLAMERETSKAQKLQTRTKKRRKAVVQQEEQDFDEDFFAQVDSEIAEQRKQRKLEKQSVPKGRHTAFVTTEDEVDSRPIQADHNIELVVLGSEKEGPTSTNALLASVCDKAGIEPSEASHLFARGRLPNGRDQAMKKGTKKKKQNDPGWKRSKKMNTMTFGRAKTKGRRGCAAANFVVKF